MNSHQCRICQNREGNREFIAREMMFGWRDKFTYFECAGCGCIQIVNIPADLARYYPPDYYSFGQAPGTSMLRDFLQKRRGRHALGLPSLLGALISAVKGPPGIPDWVRRTGVRLDDAILDVGCGAGALLFQLHRFGFTRLTGADPYVQFEINCGGVHIRKTSLSALDGSYDLVMFHHSFEHMADPEVTLREAARLTRSGGRVLLHIPVAGTYAWRTYGINWVQFDAPRHLYLHSEKSIQILAKRAGMALKEIVYDSSAFQFWGSEQYSRDIPLRSPDSYANPNGKSLFSPAEITRFEEKSRELNTASDGDQAFFYLHKP